MPALRRWRTTATALVLACALFHTATEAAEDTTLSSDQVVGTWVGLQLKRHYSTSPYMPSTASVKREIVFRPDGSFTMTHPTWSGRYRIEGQTVNLAGLYVLTYHGGGLTGFEMVFGRQAR